MRSSGSGRRLRRIAVVTGSRAEYGLLRSTLRAIDSHRDLRLQLVVTGMHLLRKFGRTAGEIARDGWRIDARVKMQSGDDGPLDQAGGVSRGVLGIARYLDRARSDILVVLGDRIEAMAGALAAITTGRLLAHIHGGDVASGDFDENLRHAITKLAHVHLAATRDAARRIIRMGEEKRRVHVVGAPGLDRIVELASEVEITRSRTGRALILQHPCGRSAARERRIMAAVLGGVSGAGLAATVVYPNSDRGHSGIIDAILSRAAKRNDGAWRVVRSLDRDAFLRTLMEADVLVGNSSCGIIEAATAGTPAVNVGLRQKGRRRSGPSVVEADETSASVQEAIGVALRKRPVRGRATVYGDGHAGVHIADALAGVALDESFRRKMDAPRSI